MLAKYSFETTHDIKNVTCLRQTIRLLKFVHINCEKMRKSYLINSAENDKFQATFTAILNFYL